jgi:hypothetical protein
MTRDTQNNNKKKCTLDLKTTLVFCFFKGGEREIGRRILEIVQNGLS